MLRSRPRTARRAALALALAHAALCACGPRRQEPQVLRATLDNGLRVVIVPESLAPTAAVVVNYLVGSNEAPPGFPGTAHAQEHMMFRGSPGLSAGQLSELAAAVGGMFNADTQQAVTQYFFTVPAADLETVLHIEAIRMRGVLDSERLWRRERGAIEQEVSRDISDPEYILYTELLADLFRGTPYAHDPLGTRASFDRTTAAMLRKFYETWYAPNNAILVIAGKVDPGRTLAAVKKLFGPIPRKSLPPRAAIRLEPVSPRRLRLKTDSPYGLVMVVFRLPGYADPDYAASRILVDALNSERGALYELTASGRALSTGFAASTLPRAGLGYAAAAFPKGGDARALLRQVERILARLAEKGIPPELVEAAKRRELADAEFQKNSVAGLAMAWSRALAVEGRASPSDDARTAAAVTAAQVDRAARRYLRLDRAPRAVLTPEASGKPAALPGRADRESVALAPPENAALPAWAADILSRLPTAQAAAPPAVSVLPNGLRLFVQPSAISRTVEVYGRVRNQPGLQIPPGREGVDEVLDRLFAYGTTARDRMAFQAALDDIAARAQAGTSFSLRAPAEHFERGLELLADNELRPALPETALRAVRARTAAAVAGRLQSPDYLARRALRQALFPKGDPALRQATPASVSALTRRDVVDYFSGVFRPDETAIVVVGDVAPRRARAAVAKYFGGWRAAGPRPATRLPPAPPNPPSITAVPDASRVQDQVALAQSAGLARNDPDYYALTLGNRVLGGGFYATRLYRQLREQAGLVYNVEASLDADRSRAVYAVDYGCDPGQVGTVRTIVMRNLRDMRARPVQPEELQQAKAMLLRELPLSESSFAGIADGLLSRWELDLPVDEPAAAARRYAAMSAAQVRDAFARWLRPDDMIQVSQGPLPR
ncbi:MAG: pitrilysin family protein [Elusimicrobia bacterium]|nr:pitrilysin family protein [Elusimicrobiota bacterium]